MDWLASTGGSGELPPICVVGDQESGVGVNEQLPLLVGSELVVEGNHHAAAVQNGVGGNEPLGLVGHDDRCSITSPKTRILQRFCQEMRALLEVTVGEAFFLALAIGFDETGLIGKVVQSVVQCCTDRLILAQVKHKEKRGLATEAQRPRSGAY